MLLKAEADPLVKDKHGNTPRQHYMSAVNAYDIDPYVVKTLRELEERHSKEKLQQELVMISANKNFEEEKRRTNVLSKKKGNMIKR